MTIIGVDVDAAVQPVITLFNNKSISMGSGVSVTWHRFGYELVLHLIYIKCAKP